MDDSKLLPQETIKEIEDRFIDSLKQNVNIRNSYCFTTTISNIKKLKQAINKLLTKVSIKKETSISNRLPGTYNVNVVKGFIMSIYKENKKQLAPETKSILTTEQEIKSDYKINHLESTNRLNEKYSFNTIKSYIMATSKIAFDKAKTKCNKDVKEVNVVNNGTITFLNNDIKFKEGVCQKLPEDGQEIVAITSNEKDELKGLIQSTAYKFNNTPVGREEVAKDIQNMHMQNIKKQKVLQSKRKILTTGGYIVNRTLIIVVTFVIVIGAFLLAIKLVK